MPEPDFLEHTLNKDIIEQIWDIMHSTIVMLQILYMFLAFRQPP